MDENINEYCYDERCLLVVDERKKTFPLDNDFNFREELNINKLNFRKEFKYKIFKKYRENILYNLKLNY